MRMHVHVHVCRRMCMCAGAWRLLQLLRPEALLGVGLRGVRGEAVVDELPLPRGAVPERAGLVDGLRQLAPIALDAQLP